MLEGIIPKVDIKKPDIPEVDCIRNDTNFYLCHFIDIFTTTEEEKSEEIIEEALGIQKYLKDNIDSDDTDNYVIVLKSPEGKYYKIKAPKSFNENKYLETYIEGKKITLKSSGLTNGYNTEYIINGGGNGRRQTAILYVIINPEWRKKKKEIETLKQENSKYKNEIGIIDEKIKKLTGTKSKNSKNIKEQIQKLKERKNILNNYISNNNKDIITKEGELKNIQKLVDFPYTPYHKDFNTIGTRSHGFSYLHDGAINAYKKLNGEKSFVGGDKKLLVKDAFSPEISTILNIVERMDWQTYYGKGMQLKPNEELNKIMQSQIEKALTTAGLNREGAFNWQRSSVGALGMGQFMPQTYDRLTKAYPNSFKEKNSFEIGAKDHSTVFRLQALHFHEETRVFPKWIKDNWQDILKDEEAKIGLYALIAAGYNGAISRVIKEANLGDKFDISLLHPDTLTKNLSSCKETQTYVMKFVFTRKYLKRHYREFGK